MYLTKKFYLNVNCSLPKRRKENQKNGRKFKHSFLFFKTVERYDKYKANVRVCIFLRQPSDIIFKANMTRRLFSF